MRNMTGAGRVKGVYDMRQRRYKDVGTVVRMRQKEKSWWCFLVRKEIMRGLRWWARRQPSEPTLDGTVVSRDGGVASRSEAAGTSPAFGLRYSSRPPSSLPRRPRRDGEIL